MRENVEHVAKRIKLAYANKRLDLLYVSLSFPHKYWQSSVCRASYRSDREHNGKEEKREKRKIDFVTKWIKDQ